MERNDPEISYGVIDPATFTQDGGPSIQERIWEGSGRKIVWRRADNSRVKQGGAMGGWDQLRSRMVGDLEDNPMIVCFSTCEDSIRTIPIQQHDPDRLEDLDTEGEDHAPDDWRYAGMSRPWIRPTAGAPAPRWPQQQTIDELIKAHRRRKEE
jgi:hypothetical protein